MEEYYKERLYTNLKEFESNLYHIHILRERLLNTFEERFPKYKDNNLKNETINLLSSIESMFQTLYSEIDTIREFYNMVKVLEDSMKILQFIKEDLIEIIPILESSLHYISDTLSEINAILKIDNNLDIVELPFVDDTNRSYNNNSYRMLIE